MDGVHNTLISQIENKGKTVMAKFSADGKEIFQSSGKGYFFVFELESSSVKKIPLPRAAGMQTESKDALTHFDVSADNELIAFCSSNGYIRLVSTKTKFSLGELKMSKDINQVAFSPDSRLLFSVGKGGVVCVWDLATRKPLVMHRDEGSNNTTSVAVSRDFRYYATGSSTGVVNVYSVESMLALADQGSSISTLKPIGTVLNLTTAVNMLQFNPEGQMLAIGSSEKNNAVRLVHIPSFSVFANYPGVVGRSFIEAWSMAFNSSGGFFAVASTHNVFLYRLPYFKTL